MLASSMQTNRDSNRVIRQAWVNPMETVATDKQHVIPHPARASLHACCKCMTATIKFACLIALFALYLHCFVQQTLLNRTANPIDRDQNRFVALTKCVKLDDLWDALVVDKSSESSSSHNPCRSQRTWTQCLFKWANVKLERPISKDSESSDDSPLYQLLQYLEHVNVKAKTLPHGGNSLFWSANQMCTLYIGNLFNVFRHRVKPEISRLGVKFNYYLSDAGHFPDITQPPLFREMINQSIEVHFLRFDIVQFKSSDRWSQYSGRTDLFSKSNNLWMENLKMYMCAQSIANSSLSVVQSNRTPLISSDFISYLLLTNNIDTNRLSDTKWLLSTQSRYLKCDRETFALDRFDRPNDHRSSNKLFVLMKLQIISKGASSYSFSDFFLIRLHQISNMWLVVHESELNYVQQINTLCHLIVIVFGWNCVRAWKLLSYSCVRIFSHNQQRTGRCLYMTLVMVILSIHCNRMWRLWCQNEIQTITDIQYERRLHRFTIVACFEDKSASHLNFNFNNLKQKYFGHIDQSILLNNRTLFLISMTANCFQFDVKTNVERNRTSQIHVAFAMAPIALYVVSLGQTIPVQQTNQIRHNGMTRFRIVRVTEHSSDRCRHFRYSEPITVSYANESKRIRCQSRNECIHRCYTRFATHLKSSYTGFTLFDSQSSYDSFIQSNHNQSQAFMEHRHLPQECEKQIWWPDCEIDYFIPIEFDDLRRSKKRLTMHLMHNLIHVHQWPSLDWFDWWCETSFLVAVAFAISPRSIMTLIHRCVVRFVCNCSNQVAELSDSANRCRPLPVYWKHFYSCILLALCSVHCAFILATHRTVDTPTQIDIQPLEYISFPVLSICFSLALNSNQTKETISRNGWKQITRLSTLTDTIRSIRLHSPDGQSDEFIVNLITRRHKRQTNWYYIDLKTNLFLQNLHYCYEFEVLRFALNRTVTQRAQVGFKHAVTLGIVIGQQSYSILIDSLSTAMINRRTFQHLNRSVDISYVQMRSWQSEWLHLFATFRNLLNEIDDHRVTTKHFQYLPSELEKNQTWIDFVHQYLKKQRLPARNRARWVACFVQHALFQRYVHANKQRELTKLYISAELSSQPDDRNFDQHRIKMDSLCQIEYNLFVHSQWKNLNEDAPLDEKQNHNLSLSINLKPFHFELIYHPKNSISNFELIVSIQTLLYFWLQVSYFDAFNSLESLLVALARKHVIRRNASTRSINIDLAT